MANEKRLIDANALLKWNEKEYEKSETKPADRFVTNIMFHAIEGAVKQAPTVDAVEVADMREFAEDVACQFGYYCQNGGRLHISHGGLSTLEWAFYILGWDNPHPVPEFECEIEGCHEHATCGKPTADGYKRMCGKHFAKMDGDGNA